jgi:hypothetical protein
MPRLTPLILALLLAACAARADCSNTSGSISVSVSPSGGLSNCAVTLDSGSGKYNVSVTRNASTTATVTINIRCTSSEDLHNVVITTASNSYQTWVSVGTNSNRFHTIDEVSRFGSGTGEVVLLDLFSSDDIGVLGSGNSAIDVDKLNDTLVGGTLKGNVVVRSGTLLAMTIGGNMSADVTATNNSIDSLTVTGSIGSGTHVQAKTGIKYLSSSSNHGTIDTKYNSGSGDLWYLRTTAGDFDGSLSTHNIESGATSGPTGISIAGNIAAPITVSGQLKEPIVMTGNLDSPITITGGVTSAGSISIGQ